MFKIKLTVGLRVCEFFFHRNSNSKVFGNYNIPCRTDYGIYYYLTKELISEVIHVNIYLLLYQVYFNN